VSDCDFLEHDSYVELRELVRVRISEWIKALATSDNPLGRLTDDVSRRIAEAALHAPTLSADRRSMIWEALVGCP
jgi:hypothetical protein